MANTTVKDIIFQDLDTTFISENRCRKEAIITPMPLYLKDSEDTDVFDFGGVIKTITLTGVFAGANQAACKTWIDSVEDLIQGHQDKSAGYPLTFINDLRGTLKVKIMDFESTQEAGETVSCTWVIKLIESSENA